MIKERNKKRYIDDGRTIYNMDLDGMPGRRRSQRKDGIDLTKRERRALIKAAFANYSPIFIGVLICFGFTIFLINIWLS
jgi:hypothetical protein